MPKLGENLSPEIDSHEASENAESVKREESSGEWQEEVENQLDKAKRAAADRLRGEIAKLEKLTETGGVVLTKGKQAEIELLEVRLDALRAELRKIEPEKPVEAAPAAAPALHRTVAGPAEKAKPKAEAAPPAEAPVEEEEPAGLYDRMSMAGLEQLLKDDEAALEEIANPEEREAQMKNIAEVREAVARRNSPEGLKKQIARLKRRTDRGGVVLAGKELAEVEALEDEIKRLEGRLKNLENK